MSALIPQPNLEELVAKKAIGLTDLLDRLATGDEPEDEHAEEAPPAPPQVSLSDEQLVGLRRLALELADVKLPEQQRLLTEAEKTEFVRLFDRVKEAKTAVANAETALREAFVNHMDIVAKDKGGKIVYDEHGHVLAEGAVLADGTGKKVTREIRGGKAVPLTEVDIARLEQQGLIDHRTYLAMTEAVPARRRFDEAKTMDLLAKRPKLVNVLAKVAILSNKTASIYVRKA